MNDNEVRNHPVGDETTADPVADMYKDKLEKLQENYDLLMKDYLEARQKIKNLTTALKNIAATM